MEDPDTQLLREKFRPSGANYRWHKMASEILPLVDGALGKLSMKTNKQGQQEKYKTKTMVASNTPAVAKNLKHQPGRKERVTWKPEEKEKVMEKVVEKFREEGMNVPGIGPAHNRENGRFLEIVRAAQEEALPPDRWKAFTQRNHIEQSKLTEPLKQRLGNKPINLSQSISMNDVAAAVDEALAARNGKAVVHLPIQAEPAKDVTTTGKEVRVINVDPNAKPPQKKVWWKAHEFQSVLTLAVNKLRSLGVGTLPTKDDYSGSRMLLEVFNSAQHQMLPRERWKKLTSRAQLESIGLLENLQTLLRQAPKQTPAETASVPPPVPELSREVPVAPPPQGPGPVSPAASAPPFQQAVAPIKPSELPENEIMAALQVLGRAITRGLAFEKQAAELTEMNTLLMEEVDGLRKRIETLDTAVRGMSKVERKEEAKAKVELPVVAVLGCRKEQFDQICTKAEERGLKLTLRHYDQDSAPRPISAQWAVSLRWVRHHWEDQVKKSGIPMSQYSFLPHGGVSQAVQMLELWFGGAA